MANIPYRICNFNTFFKDKYYYVDKTMFISKMMYLSNPFVWVLDGIGTGKSLALSLLYYFLDNREIYKANKNMWIESRPRLMKLRNTFNVIFIDFTDMESVDYDSTIYNIKRILKNFAGTFPFLFSNHKDISSLKYFQKIYELEASEEEFLDLIPKVIEQAHIDNKRNAIVLFDGLDDILSNSIKMGFFEQLKQFLTKLISSSITPQVKYMFLASCFPFDLPLNIYYHTYLDAMDKGFLSFTSSQCHDLNAGTINHDEFSLILGKLSGIFDQVVYNPRRFINILQNKNILKPYEKLPGFKNITLELVAPLIDIDETFVILMCGGILEINKPLPIPKYEDLARKDKSLILSYLVHLGLYQIKAELKEGKLVYLINIADASAKMMILDYIGIREEK